MNKAALRAQKLAMRSVRAAEKKTNLMGTKIFVQVQAQKVGDDVGSGAMQHVDIYGPPSGCHLLGHQAHPGMIWVVKKDRFAAMHAVDASVKFQTSYQLV